MQHSAIYSTDIHPYQCGCHKTACIHKELLRGQDHATLSNQLVQSTIYNITPTNATPEDMCNKTFYRIVVTIG